MTSRTRYRCFWDGKGTLYGFKVTTQAALSSSLEYILSA